MGYESLLDGVAEYILREIKEKACIRTRRAKIAINFDRGIKIEGMLHPRSLPDLRSIPSFDYASTLRYTSSTESSTSCLTNIPYNHGPGFRAIQKQLLVSHDQLRCLGLSYPEYEEPKILLAGEHQL